MSAALDYNKFQNVNKATQQITTQQKKKDMGMGISPETLDTLLNTGLQATATVVGQRAASGKSAARQARIAACGRKPLFGKKKKAAYNKCVADSQAASSGANAPLPPFDNRSGGGEEDGDNKTLMYVGIGLGVVVLGVVGFILYKKFGK